MQPRQQGISARKLLFASGMGILFDAMDVVLIGFIIAALFVAWHITPDQAGLLGSLTLVGMAIGSAAAGLFADRVGRKRAFVITLLLYSAASGLSALATGIGVLLVLRVVTGLGLGGELPVATAYVLESSPPETRGRRTVWLESFWAFGSIVAALIGFLLIPLLSWRAAFAVTVLPALYILYLRRTLPESRAFADLRQRYTVRQNILRIWQSDQRQRTIVLWVLWFAANFAYYGLFTWLPSVMTHKGFSLVNSFAYVLIMAVAQVPGYFCAAWLVDKWGRKPTLIAFSLLSAASALLFGLSHDLAWLLVFGIVLNFSNLGAWGATYIYSAEQYPVPTRASGLGWAMGFGKVGGMVAPFLLGTLVAAHRSFGFIFGMFSIVTLISLIVVLLFGRDRRADEPDSRLSSQTA